MRLRLDLEAQAMVQALILDRLLSSARQGVSVAF